MSSFDTRFDPQSRLVLGENGRATQAKLSVAYALQLLERDGSGDRQRASDIILNIAHLQLTEPEWRFGQLPMRTDRQYVDRNSNCFLLPILFEIAGHHAGKLTPDAASVLRQTLERGMVFLERRWDIELFVPHRDNLAYTNIFLLYCQCLLMGAAYFDSERLRLKGTAQWQRWFSHVAYYGLDEFASPTYTRVDAGALETIREVAPSARTREEAGLVLVHLFEMMYALFHPALGLPLSGMSRCYRRFLPPRKRNEPFVTHDGRLNTPAPDAVTSEYRSRRFPHRAQGRATTVPYTFQTWQVADAGMGTMTGGHYFPQNIYCIAGVGRDPDHREVFTVPGRHTFRAGFTDQDGPRALCVFYRGPHSYNRTQQLRPDGWMDEIEREFPPTLGITEGWEVTVSDDALLLRACDRLLAVFPFAVENGRILPTKLRHETMEVYGQQLECYLFPEAFEWIGCTVDLLEKDQPWRPPRVEFRGVGERISIKSGDDLHVRFFRQPSGEVVQLYDRDWRTMPLLKGPLGTLWPGDLVARMANAGFPHDPPPYAVPLKETKQSDRT